MPDIETAKSLAAALGDFFYSDGAAALAASWHALPGAHELDGDAILLLEYEFNRLFVGPEPPLAPPYGSVYLEREPRLMGESTRRIRRLYEMLGLAAATLPDDFLGCELEAWLLLADLWQKENMAEALPPLQWLTGSMLAWIPALLTKMHSMQLSSAMEKVAACLEAWLAEAQAVLDAVPEK